MPIFLPLLFFCVFSPEWHCFVLSGLAAIALSIPTGALSAEIVNISFFSVG